MKKNRRTGRDFAAYARSMIPFAHAAWDFDYATKLDTLARECERMDGVELRRRTDEILEAFQSAQRYLPVLGQA